jgi:hypothetical protein
MEADALGRSVVNGDKDGDLTVLGGEGGGHIRAPHRIDALRDDRAVVVARPANGAHSAQGRQSVLPHQAAHALLGGALALVAQPRPDLAIALAVERAVAQNVPDRLHQSRIGHRTLRPRSAPRHGWHHHPAAAVDAGPRHAPHPADPGQAVRAVRGDRDGGAHRFDLRAAKGAPPPPASSRSTLA